MCITHSPDSLGASSCVGSLISAQGNEPSAWHIPHTHFDLVEHGRQLGMKVSLVLA